MRGCSRCGTIQTREPSATAMAHKTAGRVHAAGRARRAWSAAKRAASGTGSDGNSRRRPPTPARSRTRMAAARDRFSGERMVTRSPPRLNRVWAPNSATIAAAATATTRTSSSVSQPPPAAERFEAMPECRSRYHGTVPHKLLLADDSVTIQRVIELTFADEDVQVIAVGNGADAIERAQRDRPDIVLADVGMPERNGYEVAAFIKGTPELAHIPVVLLTGAFEPLDEPRARAVGCDGVLVKPFEPQLVISRVKDLLAGKQPLGMWGSAPVAQGPVRQAAPPPAFEPRTAAAPQAATDS